MKKYIILFTIILLNSYGFAQTSGRAIYKTVLKKNGYALMHEELVFNQEQSVYRLLDRVQPDKVAEDEYTGEIVIYPEIPDSIHPCIRTNFINKQIYSKVFLTYDNGDSFYEYQVKEDFNIKWQLHKDTKTINNYKCRKATADFRGRSYIAWYTQDIPMSIGPWKFQGLPGFIIKIEDSKKEVGFYLEKIEIPSNIKLENEIFIDEDYINIARFKKLNAKAKKESSEEFLSRLKAKLPRGAEITLTNDEGTSDIEKEFE